MMKRTKVIIVGAGAAGIAAASRLLQEGMDNFIVLEASDRIGGRINTVKFADNVVDLGAQWVHGETGNVVHELASKHDLLGSFFSIYDASKHKFVTINGEIIPEEESIEALTTYFTIADDGLRLQEKEMGNEIPEEEMVRESESYGDYFTRRFERYYEKKPFTSRARANQFLSWMEKMECSIECCDTWQEVSATRLAEYWHCDGDPLLTWKDRGYITVFDLLLRKIPDEKKCLPVMKKIEFGKAVEMINYESQKDVTVTTSDGCQYIAPYVIFTASLGVLKEKHLKMFVPPLPQRKIQAIKGLSIGTVNKIFLEFSYKWWPDDIACFDFIWSEEDKAQFLEQHEDAEWLCDVFFIHTVNCQPNVLCVWVVGKGARNMEKLSEFQVLGGLDVLLKQALGKHYNVMMPKNMLRSQWYKNEYFRGSYTYQSMHTEHINVKPKDLAVPIVKDGNKPVILFAGEATHDHYYSTVHGAIETGFREANRIIDFDRRPLYSCL